MCFYPSLYNTPENWFSTFGSKSAFYHHRKCFPCKEPFFIWCHFHFLRKVLHANLHWKHSIPVQYQQAWHFYYLPGLCWCQRLLQFFISLWCFLGNLCSCSWCFPRMNGKSGLWSWQEPKDECNFFKNEKMTIKYLYGDWFPKPFVGSNAIIEGTSKTLVNRWCYKYINTALSQFSTSLHAQLYKCVCSNENKGIKS